MQEKINREYYIVETLDQERKLYWFEDNSATDYPYQIKLWIQSVDLKPEIMCVLPDWQLIVNSVEMERKLYLELEIAKGSLLELIYKDYKFVLRF